MINAHRSQGSLIPYQVFENSNNVDGGFGGGGDTTIGSAVSGAAATGTGTGLGGVVSIFTSFSSTPTELGPDTFSSPRVGKIVLAPDTRNMPPPTLAVSGFVFELAFFDSRASLASLNESGLGLGG